MLVDETVAAHWSLVCEITRLKRLLAMAFLKFPTLRLPPSQRPQLTQFSHRSWIKARTGRYGARSLGHLLPLIEQLGADIQGAGSGLRRAALTG
jgi:hypothetical protein